MFNSICVKNGLHLSAGRSCILFEREISNLFIWYLSVSSVNLLYNEEIIK